MALKVNRGKTEYAIGTREGIRSYRHTLNCEEFKFNSASKFKYLGILLATNNNIREELKKRNTCLGVLGPV